MSRLGRLYELRSLVRTALATMGSMLPAKITVETLPAASAGSNDMGPASFRVRLFPMPVTLGAPGLMARRALGARGSASDG